MPTVVLDPTDNSLEQPQSRDVHLRHFPNLIHYGLIHSGHNAPQEAPAEFADAIRLLHGSGR